MTQLKRLLMVEDDPDIQAIARLALEAIGGFEVTLASSGEEALIVLDTFAPDLILLDVMMPGMDGTATLQAIKAKPATSAIPVVFMTARAQAQDAQTYTKLGALGVITKPFDALALPAQVKQLWEEWADKAPAKNL